MQYATVIGEVLTIHTSDSLESDRVAKIPNGANVAVLEKNDNWCKIVYNEYTGYVMTKFLKFESDSQDDKVTVALSQDIAKQVYEALKLSLN